MLDRVLVLGLPSVKTRVVRDRSVDLEVVYALTKEYGSIDGTALLSGQSITTEYQRGQFKVRNLSEYIHSAKRFGSYDS
jgi:hypothetical protein